MGFQSRQNLVNNITKQIEEATAKKAEYVEKIEEAKASRAADVTGGDDRDKLQEMYKELKLKNQELKKEMKQYERCDPDQIAKVKTETEIAKAACNRWVDNCFEIESWMKKNNQSITSDQMMEAFPVLNDLDYIDYETRPKSKEKIAKK